MKKFLPTIAIIVLWLIFSSPYFFNGLVPFPSRFLVTFFAPWNASYGMAVKNNAMPDVITQIYPWKLLTIDAWKNGTIPLWNPYSFAGTHLAGNYQSAVFFPLNFIFLMIPFLDAWSLFIVIQPLLAGLLTLLYLRSLKVSPWGSFVGAFAYAFCGYMTTWMAYGTIGYTIAFLPLILWGIGAVYSDKPIWKRLSIPLGVCVSLTAGHLQMSSYVLASAFLYGVGYALYSKKFLKLLEVILLLFSGLLLATPQILLGYEAFSLSNRVQFTGVRELIPWQYFLTFFAPDYFGNPVTRNDWFGHYAEWNGFVGTVTMVLALVGVFLGKRKMKVFFALLFIFCLLFSYNTPLATMVYTLNVPFFSTSAAGRFIAIGSFCLTILAAFGFDALYINPDRVKRKKTVILSFGLLVPFVILFLTAQFQIGLTPEAALIAKRNAVLPLFLATCAIACMLVQLITPKKIKIATGVILLVLISFDGLRFANKWMPFDERQFVYPPQKMTAFLQERIGLDRVFGNVGGEYSMSARLPVVEGYDAVYIGRFGKFVGATSKGIVSEGERSVVHIDKNGQYTPKFLALLGVRFIIHRISDGRNVWAFPYWEYGDRMKSIYRDEHYEIFEFTDALPRVLAVSSYEMITDDQQIVDTLFSEKFDPASSVILETVPGVEPETGTASAVIREYSYNRVGIRSDSQTPKIIVLSDTWAPGWKAYVDGKQSDILRANFTFRAVAVDAGSHDIVFSYEPFGAMLGYLIAGITSVTLLVTVIITNRLKKRKNI